MTRHIFKYTGEERLPVVGDLIRNVQTGDFINIVLEVTPMPSPFTNDSSKWAAIRSVRYGKTNGNDFIQLHGKRSRSILIDERGNTCKRSRWLIVEEFVQADNKKIRMDILESMKDVDTAWRGDNVAG